MSQHTKPTYEELEARLAQATKHLRQANFEAQSTKEASDTRSAMQRSSRFREVSEAHSSATDLAQREALHRAILDSSTEYAIISLDCSGIVTSWNEGAVQTMGWTEDEMLGRPAHVFFTPEQIEDRIPELEMSQAIETGRGEDERYHLHKDGSRFWANGLMMPLEADGEHIGFVKILRDRSIQHRAEEDLKRVAAELAFDRATLRAVFENAPVGLSLAAAPTGESILINEQMRRLSKRDFSAGGMDRYLGAGAIHEDGAPYALDDYPQVQAIRHGIDTHAAPFLIERPDGTRLRTEISSVPLLDAQGSITGAVSVVVDVHEREQAIEQQEILTGELAHRMKNTMAMVQAIVHQTLRSASTLDEARESVTERFEALARAQDLITASNWQASDLGGVVKTALASVNDGECIAINGEPSKVGARAALSLTLVLHELATNAVKYGALSVPEGRVMIDWHRQDCGGTERLVFTWSEQGGPPVQAPTRKGFGTRLIDSMGRSFGGRSELRYSPEGVCWLVEADPARLLIL
ncbi:MULTISPECIES: PAS domain S-box protein [unclassified Sphingomonas]|uniref:sensor histidine kinase n=1 Tax=unclassified Sphingomonas TaxID=196159 RepID=UPI00226A3DA9|nr:MULTISPECIES: PAS domain S-box protein [unclassified Sphingomonas]